MPILQIEHGVRDFDTWKQGFDNDPIGREQGDVRRYRVVRPTDDPNYVIVDLEFDSAAEAGDNGRDIGQAVMALVSDERAETFTPGRQRSRSLPDKE